MTRCFIAANILLTVMSSSSVHMVSRSSVPMVSSSSSSVPMVSRSSVSVLWLILVSYVWY